jgi:hypothetical protein
MFLQLGMDSKSLNRQAEIAKDLHPPLTYREDTNC